MEKLSRLGILIALAAIFAAPAALAAETVIAEADRADLRRVEQYLNDIRTMKARFLQSAPNGALSEGTIFLRRPGRLRFEYDPPFPVLIVVDGIWVVFYDKEVGQVSRIPLSSTPLAELVRAPIDLLGSDAVVAVERIAGLLRVTLVNPEQQEQGSLTLVFDNEPLRLRQWTVRDAQGQQTRVSLTAMARNIELDPALFVFFEPKDDDYGTN